MATLYGPQFWTAGDFGQEADYTSTEAAGEDAPISGYPDLWSFENLDRVEGAGPSGENVLDVFPGGTGGEYDVSGCAITPGRLGSLPNYQLDCYQGGNGIVIEWWQKLSTEAFGEDVFGNGLILQNGGVNGAQPGLIVGINSMILHLETIEGDGQTTPQFQWWLRVRRWDTGFDYVDGEVNDVADDEWHYMQIVLKPGTIVGDFDDVLSDGSYAVYKDATPGVPHSGTQLFNVSGVPVTINEAATSAPDGYYMKSLWHGFFDMIGPVTGTWIYTVPMSGGGEEEVPDAFDCMADEAAASRGGALQALLVDIGSGSLELSDYPVPGSLTTEILAQPHAAPGSLTVTVQAGGTSLPGTAYYAICTVHDGVLSELSAVQSATVSDGTSRVRIQWSGLASGADFVRIFRGGDPDFLQYDRYRVSGYPYAEMDVPASESEVFDLYFGYNTRGEPPTPDGADPHWDLNYRQNKAYMISALYDDGTESACSPPVEAQLWPRNAPLTVRVTWAAPGGSPPAGVSLTGYRLRRMNATYHYEFANDRQWDFDTSVTTFDDPNTDTTAVAACATATGGKPIYCLAGHWLKQIRAVFVFKPHPVTGLMAHIPMVEGVDYTQQVFEVNGNRYHCIIFEEQQRSDQCEFYDVTADVDGVETNADGTGTLLTNIDDIWEHILFNIIFNTYRSSVGTYAPVGGKWFYDVPYSPGLIDRPSIAAAKVVGEARFSGGYPGGGLLVDQVNARQLIHDLLVSADLQFYQHSGVWYTKRFDPDVARSSLPLIGPDDDVFRESFEPFLLTDKQRNLIPFFGGPIGGNPDNGWLASGELQDDTSIDLYRRVIISEPIYLLWTQSRTASYDIVSRYLQWLRFPPIGARFHAVINRYSLPPGTLVRITHRDGLGAGGWVERVCMVLSNELDFDSLTCHITVRDIDDLVPA